MYGELRETSVFAVDPARIGLIGDRLGGEC